MHSIENLCSATHYIVQRREIGQELAEERTNEFDTLECICTD